MSKKLKILFLTPRFPLPLIGGDRLKSYHLLKHLVKSHEVSLVTFSHGAMPAKTYIDQIENMGIDLHIIPLKPIKAGLKAGTVDLFSRPLEIGFYTQNEFQATVDELILQKNFDLGFAFFMRTAEYIKNARFKKVLISEDCRILYQKRCADNSNNILQKGVRLWEYRMLKRYEPKVTSKFDAVTLVTNEDIEEMKKYNPKANYRLLTNGTDIDWYKPQSDNKPKSGILYTGKLDVWNNEVMALDIAKKIFPKLKEKFNNLKYNIVGAYPTKSVLSLMSDSIKVYPNVPDLLPFLQSAELFLHPHIGATGIQNKILEAMACGCPVITTKTGVQGIEAIHGEHAMIGMNNEDHYENALKVLTDKELAQKLSKNARKLIEETHSWDTVFNQLDGIIDEVMS
jgi:glycosyltransferase involved in cell wall biosynthesis